MTSPVPFGEWQPIESAPKDGTVILVGGRYPGGETFYSVVYWSAGLWKHRDAASPLWEQYVAYWLPLDALPPLPSPPEK